jgi:hypothetical protein
MELLFEKIVMPLKLDFVVACSATCNAFILPNKSQNENLVLAIKLDWTNGNPANGI